jgi:hypothetical protein
MSSMIKRISIEFINHMMNKQLGNFDDNSLQDTSIRVLNGILMMRVDGLLLYLLSISIE